MAQNPPQLEVSICRRAGVWLIPVRSVAPTGLSVPVMLMQRSVPNMPPVNNVYVYPLNSNPAAPPPPLLGPMNGTMQINLYMLPDAANNGGLVVGQQYDLTINVMTPNNRGTPATCHQVAPPSYDLTV